jgi:hypothetical protein
MGGAYLPFLNNLSVYHEISNKMNKIPQTRRTKYGALWHSVTGLVPFCPAQSLMFHSFHVSRSY